MLWNTHSTISLERMWLMRITLLFNASFSPHICVKDPGLEVNVRYLDRWEIKIFLLFFLYAVGYGDKGTTGISWEYENFSKLTGVYWNLHSCMLRVPRWWNSPSDTIPVVLKIFFFFSHCLIISNHCAFICFPVLMLEYTVWSRRRSKLPQLYTLFALLIPDDDNAQKFCKFWKFIFLPHFSQIYYIVVGHIKSKIPDPIRTLQSNDLKPTQYHDRRRRGNRRVLTTPYLYLFKSNISKLKNFKNRKIIFFFL